MARVLDDPVSLADSQAGGLGQAGRLSDGLGGRKSSTRDEPWIRH